MADPISNGESGLSVRTKINGLIARLGSASVGLPAGVVFNGRGVVVSMVGDSNTHGRPGWQLAVDREWKTKGGAFYGATIYNNGANGSTLKGWVDNIVTKAGDARDPTNFDTANPWDAVSANPDLVIIDLGTNDVNWPTGRATDGTEANLRTNLAALIDFFKTNTNAMIWLRMPQPYLYEPPGTGFGSTTLWTDVNDAAATSATMALVYREWINVDQRVIVHDSHLQLFGERVDDKTTEGLDPYTGGEMIADGLHCTDLGYRRHAQSMARQIAGLNDEVDIFPSYPNAILDDAVWSETFFLKSVGGSAMTIDVNPIQQVGGSDPWWPDQSSTCSNLTRKQLVINERLVAHGLLNRLQNIGSGPGSIKIYCHESGNVYAADAIAFSSAINGSEANHTVTLSFTGVTFDAADDQQLVTIWVSDPMAMPYQGMRATQDIFIYLQNGQTQSLQMHTPNNALLPLKFVDAIRNNGVSTCEISIYEQNAGWDGAYDAIADPGKRICKIHWPDFGYRIPDRFDWYPENYPSGFLLSQSSYLAAIKSSGDFGSNVSISLAFRQRVADPGPPAFTTQPTNQSVASGNDATFTSVASNGPSYYRWQISTDGGTTWADIVGATSANYTEVATDAGDNGHKYRCIASNKNGGVISNVATLTVT